MQDSSVSFKSTIVVYVFGVGILIITLVVFLLENTSRLYICNDRNYLTTYIRMENNTDILINPSLNSQVILECLGKGMPFYDRTIEYVLGGSKELTDELSKRYKIDTILKGDTFTIGTYRIELYSTYQILVKNNTRLAIINKPNMTVFNLKHTDVVIIPDKNEIYKKMNPIIVASGTVKKIELK